MFLVAAEPLVDREEGEPCHIHVVVVRVVLVGELAGNLGSLVGGMYLDGHALGRRLDAAAVVGIWWVRIGTFVCGRLVKRRNANLSGRAVDQSHHERGGDYHVHAMSRIQATMGHDVTMLTTWDEGTVQFDHNSWRQLPVEYLALIRTSTHV